MTRFRPKHLFSQQREVYLALPAALAAIVNAEAVLVVADDFGLEPVVVSEVVEHQLPPGCSLKTDRSNWELPIPDPVYSALLHARAVQQREKRDAGDKYLDTGYLFDDQIGRPVYPDFMTDRWRDACKRAGVPVINLHDERHSCATLMIRNGVPIPTVSAWLDHATAAFTTARCVHNQPDQFIPAAESYGALVQQRR